MPDLVTAILDEMERCPGTMAAYLRSDSTADSSAAQDLAAAHVVGAFAADLIQWALLRSRQGLVIAGDSMSGLARIMRLPPVRFAQGGVSRSVLESSARVLWILEAGLPIDARIERLARLRRAELQEELTISREGLALGVTPEATEARDFAEASLRAFDEGALGLGIRVSRMVGATDLVAHVLQGAYQYRLLSALSHGMPYAAGAVSGMYGGGQQAVAAAYLFFTHEAADAYLRAVWTYASYVEGNPSDALRGELTRCYGTMGFDEDVFGYLGAAGA